MLFPSPGHLDFMPRTTSEEDMGANAVWVRGFRNVRRLQKQAFQ